MPIHDYTAKDALKLLLAKVESLSDDLSVRMREAIDAGKAELKKVVEPSDSGRGPKRKRQYWQIVPYTDEEALQVALTVLESHLLETRLLLNTASDDFTKVGELPPKPVKPPMSSGYADVAQTPLQIELPEERVEPSKAVPQNVDVQKNLVIDAEPEQLQEKQLKDDLQLEPVPYDSIDSLQAALGNLAELMNFEGGQKHGNTR